MITEKLIDRFYEAHPQHEIQITILSREHQRLKKDAVLVHFNCHNGKDWMGLTGTCRFEGIENCIRGLIKELHKRRPDLELLP